MKTYPNIDMKKTGILLKQTLAEAGYSVRDIQEYLGLSCPQSIYRWFKGEALPSVDHLYALSVLLEVHMEELVVSCLAASVEPEYTYSLQRLERLLTYYERLQEAA